MNETSVYFSAAEAYADGATVLFAASGVPTGERGGRGPVSFENLAEQAEELAPISAQYTEAAAVRVTDPEVSMEVSAGLLAKALTDLQVGAYLYQAAEDEEDRLAWDKESDRDRSRSSAATTSRDQLLDFVLGKADPPSPSRDRGAPPATIPKARVVLNESIEDSLDLILERAAKTGQSAIGGLVSMGGAELAQAAGMVGMEIAGALGHAEELSNLYKLASGYVSNALESVIALIGKPVAELAAKQALDWIGKLKDGELFADLLDKVYETGVAADELKPIVANSPRDLPTYIETIDAVDRLESAHRRQIRIAGKLLKGFGLLGMISIATFPYARIAQAAAYIALGAYVVLSGADYVDAPELDLIDRVPGVRLEVETRLALPQPGGETTAQGG